QRRFTGPAYDAMLFIPRPRSEQRLVDFLTLVGDTPVTLHTREAAVAAAVLEYSHGHPSADIRVVLLDPLPPGTTTPLPHGPSIPEASPPPE
ncbi:MAG: hypothetical protein ACRDT4_02180, partial [Micromonosporaceae bacterium]